MVKTATRDDILVEAQAALAAFAAAVVAHRDAVTLTAYVPIYLTARDAHRLTEAQVADVQRRMAAAPADLQTYWMLLRRTVKELKTAILPQGDGMRRLLVMSTGSPDEYRQRLHEEGFTFPEVYVATLAGLVGNAHPRGDLDGALAEATRTLNAARTRCLDVREALRADVEQRQRTLEQFVQVFGP